ncbi:hypothetical protein ABEF95_006707 [Exophiala dermatitidis]
MSPQIPEVTVIVKVPMIAMKYPMPNGQIRRFQIRFATNEDYYEAMKMLSRADVPTVEAGSFPAQKSQTGPRSLPRNLVTPSDSASQIGLPAETSAFLTNQKPDHAAMGPPRYSTASFAPQPAPIARSTMAPPNYFPATTDISQRHPQIPLSVAGPWPDRHIPGNQISAAQSNISLSTAKTLVGAANRPGPRARPAYTNTMADAADAVESRVADLPISVTEPRPPQADNAHIVDRQGGLGLPPKRELPFRRTEPAKTEKQRTDNKQQGQTGVDGTPQADDSNSVTTTVVTGKRKRAATRKTLKPSTAKKPRTTTTRKKTGKDKEDTPPVPSVEELLQKQDSPIQRRNDQLRDIQPPAQKSQTRVLRVSPSAEIPESDACSSKSQTGKCGIRSPSLGGEGNVTRRITRSASKCLGTAFLELGRHGEKDVHEVQKTGRLPCTPADQIVVPLTPSSPLGGAAVSKRSKMLAPPPAPPAPLRRRGPTTRSTKTHKPHIPEQADSAGPEGTERNSKSCRSQTNNSFTCADLPPTPPSGSSVSAAAAAAAVAPLAMAPAASDVPSAPAPHKTLPQTLAYLESDPDPGNEKLQAWSALPPATGIPLLRSYFCKLIMDPNFSALCKTLGSFWEREILERRIGQMSGVGDDIMMSVSRDRDAE